MQADRQISIKDVHSTIHTYIYILIQCHIQRVLNHHSPLILQLDATIHNPDNIHLNQVFNSINSKGLPSDLTSPRKTKLLKLALQPW